MQIDSKGLKRLKRPETWTLPPHLKADYFHLARIRHPRISEVSQAMHALSYSRGGAAIVMLVGPPGVGKTTAISAVTDDAIKILAQQQESGTSSVQLPVLVSEAIASGETKFSWDAFYERALIQLGEPLIECTVQDTTRDGRAMVSRPRGKPTVAGKRERLERAMKYRGTRMFIVDEALRVVEADDDLKALKSLANTCGATVVLVGAFDLLKYLVMTGQIARRSESIGFHRYNQAEKSPFLNAVKQLERDYWPFEGNPGFSEKIDTFFEATHGCFGMMKDCMSISLGHALAAGKWHPDFLFLGIKSRQQRLTILSEIVSGEALWENMDMGSTDLIVRVKK